MKSKHIYLLIAVLLIRGHAFPQALELDLSSANCQKYNGKLYVFGFLNDAEKTILGVYEIDSLLKKTDSSFIEVGKVSAQSFLGLYSDTLHNFLNIYLQEKEKKLVSIIRYNKTFERVAFIKSVDVARLNNVNMLGNETLYFINDVYAIKEEGDSLGKQFYLNKYRLKSDLENFDYQFKWQFPFERKNIESAHVFYATSKYVFLFVHRSGELPGQWVLQIDAENGRLLRGSKLNEKAETSTYEFGNFAPDGMKRSLYVTGQKFTANELKPGSNKLNLTNQQFATVFYVEIDSLGEFKTKQEFKIPIAAPTGIKKKAGGFLIRTNSLERNNAGDVFLEADIYRMQLPEPCFRFVNTLPIRLIFTEDKLVLQKNTIAPNLSIDDLYTTMDKLDQNGKLCFEDGSFSDRAFYQALTFPAKLFYKTDPEQNPMWILMKSEARKNKIHYYVLKPNKKIYQMEKIASIENSNRPAFIALSSTRFVITQQLTQEKYELKPFNW